MINRLMRIRVKGRLEGRPKESLLCDVFMNILYVYIESNRFINIIFRIFWLTTNELYELYHHTSHLSSVILSLRMKNL